MASQLPVSQCLDVLNESAIGEARRMAASTAKALGFESQTCEEIALAATELASNLAKYAQAGKLTISPQLHNGMVGIEIETRDSGPGIPNIERALTDGFSTSGGLGIGLGSVNRLMDELDIQSEPGRGTHVVSRKWLREDLPVLQSCPLGFGSAMRPMLPNEPNGDVIIIKRWGGTALVSVIDGLGHGQYANRAALAARQYVETHYDLSLQDIFLGVGRACRATRGVVMALARFDWEQGKLSFASVGNIEARVLKNPEAYSFAVRRGIVGVNAITPVVTVHDWDPSNTMVLHSDGVRTHWSWRDFAGLSDQPAAVMAQEMLRLLARENDDASVVVIRSIVL